MPPSLARVPPRRGHRRMRCAPARRCGAPRAGRSRRRSRRCRFPMPAVSRPIAIPTPTPAAPYKVDRLSGTRFTEPLLNTPQDDHGSQQGNPRGQERDLAEGRRALDGGRDARNRRGRQRLRRSLLHSRLRRPQRRVHRRHPRSGRQRSAKTSSPSRSKSCAGRHRPSPDAAPRAAPSTSSPSRRPTGTSPRPRRPSGPTPPSG